MGTWISAYIQPTESGTYLVAVKVEGEKEALVLPAWYNAKYRGFGDVGWSLLNEFYSLTDTFRNNITHWMAWPDPPEEEHADE